jgi:thiamine transport system permease protein
VLPVATIVDTGLRPDGRLDVGGITQVLTDPGLRGVVWFTFW